MLVYKDAYQWENSVTRSTALNVSVVTDYSILNLSIVTDWSAHRGQILQYQIITIVMYTLV